MVCVVGLDCLFWSCCVDCYGLFLRSVGTGCFGLGYFEFWFDAVLGGLMVLLLFVDYAFICWLIVLVLGFFV